MVQRSAWHALSPHGARQPLAAHRVAAALSRRRPVRSRLLAVLQDSPPAPAAHLADVRGTLRMTESTIATIDRQSPVRERRSALAARRHLSWSRRTSRAFIRRSCARMGRYQPSRLDDFLAWLSPETRSAFIDPRSELLEETELRLPVYHKTDSHWNHSARLSRTRRSSRFLQRLIGSIGRNWRPSTEWRFTPKLRPAATLPRGSCIFRGIFPIRTSCCAAGHSFRFRWRAERDRVVVSKPPRPRQASDPCGFVGWPLATPVGGIPPRWRCSRVPPGRLFSMAPWWRRPMRT